MHYSAESAGRKGVRAAMFRTGYNRGMSFLAASLILAAYDEPIAGDCGTAVVAVLMVVGPLAILSLMGGVSFKRPRKLSSQSPVDPPPTRADSN
jgi:hypothetical protein